MQPASHGASVSVDQGGWAAGGDRAPRHRQFRLWHSPVDCTGCGLCIDMCPNHALSVAGETSWTDLLSALPDDSPVEATPAAPADAPRHRRRRRPTERALRTGLVRACARCGASHGRPGELCATCEATVANPFSVRLPPGFTFPDSQGR